MPCFFISGRFYKIGNGINPRLKKVDVSSVEADFELTSEERADYRGETLPVDVYSNALRDAKADAEVIKESAKIAAKHIRKEAESQADEMRTQVQEVLDSAKSEAQELTESAEKKAEILRSENKQLTAENDNLWKTVLIDDKRKLLQHYKCVHNC